MPRIAVSDLERQAIRHYARETRPKPRQIDIINWFEEKYGRRLRQSTISESLSDRFTLLDSDIPLRPGTSLHQRPAQWPILEIILFEWQKLIQQQGGQTTGELLLQKARDIWPQIPEYSGQPTPSFSQGWLSRFKKRHQIKEHIRHGELGSVPQNSEEEMRAVQTLCGEYPEEDIFNMDETGLFWRSTLSRGLSNQPMPGLKKNKSRISVVCCCNYTGTQRMPLWLIGKAKMPHALRGVNIKAYNCVWQSNKKAWMTGLVMAEWLKAFYSWIGTRKVLLLLDNFSAHAAGIELSPPPANIHIQWLPANTTSRYQPLDQGIIQNLKQLYRKSWLQYLISQYEQQLDPYTSIHLLFTLKWISAAWINIKNTTIYCCFRKAQIQPVQESIQLPIESVVGLESIFEQACSVANIQDAMNISNFLNPDDENTPPSEVENTVDIEDIIARHTQQADEEMDESNAEQDIVEIIIPTATEAMRAIQLLQRFQTYREAAESSDITYLDRLERQVQAESMASMRQGTLHSWLM